MRPLTERPGSGDGDDQGDADQTHRAAGGEPGRDRPPRGARYPGPGQPGEQSPASRHEPDVQPASEACGEQMETSKAV